MKRIFYLPPIFCLLLLLAACAPAADVVEDTPAPTAVPVVTQVAAEVVIDGNVSIVRIDADGSNPRPLTAPEHKAYVAGWSPDGRQLVLTASPDGNTSIYIINADGTDFRPLYAAEAVSSSPVWSPDGTRIAFTSRSLADYSDQGVYVIHPDGTGLRRLTETVMEPNWLSWSPDGTQLLFSASQEATYDRLRTDIYVINADGSNLRNLTAHAAEDSGPAWSPDGERILFGSNRDGNWDLYVMNADGSQPQRLTQTPGDDGYASWSPHGRHILFKSNQVTGQHPDAFDLFVINADGTGLQNLTDNPANDDWPQWSPDGRAIAFTSDRAGHEEIYVMAADGSDLTRLTQTDGRHWPVLWSPDGAHLVFNSSQPPDAATLPQDVIEITVTPAAVEEVPPGADPAGLPGPADCTPLPDEMTLTATTPDANTIEVTVTGLQPWERPVIILMAESEAGSVIDKWQPAQPVGEEGRYAATFDVGRHNEANDFTLTAWQVQVLHAGGAACTDVTLPTPNAAVTPTAVPPPVPTPTAKPPPADASSGRANDPRISADGRFVTFVSEANNLVPDDTNRDSDIFLYDVQTGQMARISTSSP